MVLRIFIFIFIFIFQMASSQAAALLSCTSPQFPHIHLSAEVSETEGLWSGKYILKINLTNPLEEANTRIVDIYSSPLEAGRIILSDSYIHGIQLLNANSWQAELQIFDLEKPILLTCQ